MEIIETLETVFCKDDFSGSGQYVVRINNKNIKWDEYLLTLIKKVCYGESGIHLVDLSDWLCHFNVAKDKEELAKILTEWLYKMASREEVMRAIKAQSKDRFYK